MVTQSHRLKRLDILVLAIGLALFLALTCYQLDLPGPHYDEAIEVLPAMQILLGQPVETFRGAGLHVGETLLPIMVMDYIGAMNTYLVLPFFASFLYRFCSLARCLFFCSPYFSFAYEVK